MCADTHDQLQYPPAVHALVDVIEEFAGLTSPIDALIVLARHEGDLGLGEALIAFDDDATAVHPPSLVEVVQTEAFDELRSSLTGRGGFAASDTPVTPDGRKIQGSLGFAEALLEEAEVAVVPGGDFGDCAEAHVRLSFAASNELIIEGCRRIDGWLRSLRKS